MGRRLLLISCASLLALASAGRAQAETVSRQQLLYEIAITYKTLGDEQFLNADRVDATESYQAASKAAAGVDPDLGLVTDADARLLKNEIEYRQALLKAGASFWGFEHRLRPTNPVGAWREFGQTYETFKAKVIEIDALVVKIQAGNKDEFDDAVAAVQAAQESAVNSLQADAESTKLRHAALRRAMVQDRVNAIAQRQASIVTERGPLIQQMSQRTANLNAQLLDAAAGAMGVPPNTIALVTAASTGDVEAALQAAAAAYVASDGAAFSGTLGEIGNTTRQAVEGYQELKKLSTQAETGAEFLRAVQSGDVARATRAGAGLYQSLPAATQAELRNSLAGSRTVQTAMRLARQGSEVRDAVAAYAATTQSVSSLLRPELDNLLDVKKPNFEQLYAQGLTAAVSTATTVDAQQRNLVWLSRSWATTVVDDMLPNDERLLPIARAMGATCNDIVTCRTWLRDRIKAQGLTGSAVQVAADGKVRLINPADGKFLQAFELKILAQTAATKAIELDDKLAVEKDADAFLADLDEAQAGAMQRLLAILPDADFDYAVAPILNGLPAADAEAVIVAIAPSDATGGDLLTRGVASLSLGRDLARRTVLGSAPPAPPAPPPSPGSATPPGTSAEEQAMLSALAASGPYGMAAATAVKMLGDMSELSRLAEQTDRLDAEDRALSVERMHLTPLQADINADEALALTARRIAEARVAGAEQRGSLLQTALLQKGEQTSGLSQKVRRRLPLTYFLAELMREDYDRLEQSIAQWQGQVGSSGRRIESLLKGDPRTGRVALDPDIRFYDWFVREGEGQREDLDKLYAHWSQLEVAAGNVCVTVGCSLNTAEMGWVANTSPVPVERLAADLGKAGSVRRVPFTLLPDDLPDLPQLERLRLVSVAASVRDRATGATSSAQNVEVRHSGLGYLLIDGEGAREILETSDALPLEFLATDADVTTRRNELQHRWLKGDGLRPLEGYALFGVYELSLPPSFDPTTQWLELTFFYQRPKNTTPVDARLQDKQIQCAATSGLSAPVPAESLRLLMRRDTAGVVQAFDAAAGACTVKNAPPP